MRIKSIHLQQYKRFVKELTITNIPETARLVVLIGPNGCGKSCVFDGFLFKMKQNVKRVNQTVDNEYFGQLKLDEYSNNFAKRIDIKFYPPHCDSPDWKTRFSIRSPYRNESDFKLTSIQKPQDQTDQQFRISRIIDPDQSVAQNYQNLAWKGHVDLYGRGMGSTTFDEYRSTALGDLQTVMAELFQNPSLKLQDFGGVGKSGTFRFSKGMIDDFHYKNLSGGEKAAFDILLDIFVKRDTFKDSIYCIDEPELHLATSLQGRLLRAMLHLIPEPCQLWIATHSIGFVREAFSRMQEKGDVAFLNFYDRNFDEMVELQPESLNRTHWNTIYQDTLADLRTLVAPKRIVLCEGDAKEGKQGFDAKCYNRIFSEKQPETLFVSRGGCGNVLRSDELIGVLKSVTAGTEVRKLIDRDETPPLRRTQLMEEDRGVRILSRREIEDYLFDPEVLRTFLTQYGSKDVDIDCILEKRNELVERCKTVKKATKALFAFIEKTTTIAYLGDSVDDFALEYLVPALVETSSILQQLDDDIFG